MTAPLAELALTNVLLRLSHKVIFTKLIRNYVRIVVHVLMFARLKLFIRINISVCFKILESPLIGGLFLWLKIRFPEYFLIIRLLHQLRQGYIGIILHVSLNNFIAHPNNCPAWRFVGKIDGKWSWIY